MVQSFLIGIEDVNEGNKKTLEGRIDQSTKLFRTAEDAREHIPLNDYIEVFGAWEDACVASVISDSLRRNTKVRVPKGFTFKSSETEVPLRTAVTWRFESENIRYRYYANKDYQFFYPALNS